MKLIFLGTSAGTITTERNVSALALNLMLERKAWWLFDCGEGTQHQILKTKLKLSKLEKFFISHLHGDHLFGLPGLLTTRSLMQNMPTLTVYGPKGIKQFIDTVTNISYLWLTYLLEIIEITQPMELFNDDQFTISCDELSHRITSFGYRIVEKDQAAQLNIDKLNTDRVPRGEFSIG